MMKGDAERVRRALVVSRQAADHGNYERSREAWKLATWFCRRLGGFSGEVAMGCHDLALVLPGGAVFFAPFNGKMK